MSEFANCAATDQVLWVKYWDAGAISAQDNMIPANIELVRRHPEYLSVRDYRPGLAYILRLSLWRRLKKGDPAGILRDIRNLRDAFGPREATRLLLERRNAKTTGNEKEIRRSCRRSGFEHLEDCR